MMSSHFIERHSIPVVTSLPARTVLPTSHPLNLGHVGVGYGMRAPNIVADRIADLVVCLGASLCTRQVGVRKEGNYFAERAKVIRVDIDECSLKRRVGAVEDCYIADVRNVLRVLKGMSEDICSFQDWADVCTRVREDCACFDDSDPGRVPNNALRELSAFLPKRCSVFVDVGQHMMWASHSMELGEGRRVFFSGGHGAMGWSLPAAIGAAFGSLDPVVVVTGDGGLQMNIQELQMASSNHLPIKVIVLNNSSLGMIVACQESYLEGRRVGTDATSGYTAPNFSADRGGVRHWGAVVYLSVTTFLDLLPTFVDPHHFFLKSFFQQEPSATRRLKWAIQCGIRDRISQRGRLTGSWRCDLFDKDLI